MTTALIIDDHARARQFLRADIEDVCPQVKIIAEADGVVSGLKSIRKEKPDLVFLDIHLEDGTGFDILELTEKITFKVIFTTASDAHAIRAFKFSALDYLLKPIDRMELQNAVLKATQQPNLPSENLQVLKGHLRKNHHKAEKERIALHTASKIHICVISDIIRCESDVNYTHFRLVNHSDILVTKTLKQFDQLLTPIGFLRVHQSHLINPKEVKEFVKADGGYLVMTNGDRVPVSNRRRQEVIQKITRNHS
ncbi:MAG: response regulator [Owenweeksia sp.]|nr:response regulator [Owenweeksia sp.]